MSIDIWSFVKAEREALARDLADLPDGSWETPSLCEGWSVRDLLAHMTNTAVTSPPKFLLGLASSGFNFDKFIAKGIAAQRGSTPQETLQRFRAIAGSRTAPPGPKTSWLGEAIVHAEDIRHPLGITHDYPTAALRALADFYKGSNTLIGAKKRIAGVRLRATDDDWEHGDGALAEGPLLACVMAMTGRKAFLDKLSGPGVDILRTR